MKCRACSSSNTRVTCTEHKLDTTRRYCRCLDCGTKFRTIEHYETPKRGAPQGLPAHPNQTKPGSLNGSSVLTEQNVMHIRELAAQKQTYASIAATFGIHKDTVYKIVKHKAWKHVT